MRHTDTPGHCRHEADVFAPRLYWKNRLLGTARDSLVDVPPNHARPLAVLIGDLTLLRPLGAAGIGAIVATTDPHDPTLRSRYVTGSCVVPGFVAGAAEATARTLCCLGDRIVTERGEKVPLLFGTDAQLAFVYAFEQDLRSRYLFLLNEPELGRALLDKQRFSALAAASLIPTPRTVSGIDALRGALSGPVFVKPMRKTEWRSLQASLFDGTAKGRVFSSASELRHNEAFRAHAEEVVVQEHIAHEPNGLFSFHGFADEESRVLASFVGRKIRTYPSTAGESSYIELAEDAAIEALGTAVVRMLGLRGPFKIDIVRERGSVRDWVLEVNARFTLWSYLGAVCGINLPAIACRYLTRGEVPDRPRLRHRSFRWVNFYRDFLAFRERRADGTLDFSQWAVSLSPRRKVYETFAWTDPEPFAWWFGQVLWRKSRGAKVA